MTSSQTELCPCYYTVPHVKWGILEANLCLPALGTKLLLLTCTNKPFLFRHEVYSWADTATYTQQWSFIRTRLHWVPQSNSPRRKYLWTTKHAHSQQQCTHILFQAFISQFSVGKESGLSCLYSYQQCYKITKALYL